MIRYHARWVLPISRSVISDGTVVEHGGKIVYAGPRAGAPPGEDRDLGDAVLMPGLVNTHTHLELTAFGGLLDGLPFREWIVTLQAAKTAVMTREHYLDSARFGIAEGLRCGITTYADTCDSGVGLEAMRDAGVRGIMYQEVFGPAPAQAAESMRTLEEKLTALAPLESDLVRLGVSPHAPYTVSDDLFQATAKLGRPMAIHLAESEAETQLIVDAAGPFADALRRRSIDVAPRATSPVALLKRLGVLAAHPLLIHCVRIDAADIAAIAEHDCAVAHCPNSNRILGHGTAPLAELLAAHVRTGLGSDSMASNERMDMLMEARLVILSQHARNKELTASRSLELATLGGARALGLDKEIGTLDPGKSADLAAFAMIPFGDKRDDDPATALLSSLTPRRAQAVVVAGTVKLWDNQLLNADRELTSRVSSISSALQTWRRGMS